MSSSSINPAQRLWWHFLFSFALSDHLGDAAEAVREFAQRMGLQMPPGDAGLEEWVAWVGARGVEDGLWSEAARQASREHVASAQEPHV